MSRSLGLGMALSVSRLGQGQAREAGTEKSDVSGISLSRAECSIVYALAVGQPERKAPMSKPKNDIPLASLRGPPEALPGRPETADTVVAA